MRDHAITIGGFTRPVQRMRLIRSTGETGLIEAPEGKER